MSLPANHHVFCCTSAKIVIANIGLTITGPKMLDFVISVANGKLACRPKIAFVMKEQDVGEFLFSVITSESDIAHTSTEFFCNFHVTGPSSDPAILVVSVPKVVLREDFDLDTESELLLECEKHPNTVMQVKVLRRKVKSAVKLLSIAETKTLHLIDRSLSSAESNVDKKLDPRYATGLDGSSDPGHMTGSDSDAYEAVPGQITQSEPGDEAGDDK